MSTSTRTEPAAERAIEDELARTLEPSDLPRLLEQLPTMSEVVLRAWAPRLLEVLDRPETTDPSTRGALTQAVLRAGYPWALQLDPNDLEHSRPTRSTFKRSTVRRLGVVAVVALLGAVLGARAVLRKEEVLPDAFPPKAMPEPRSLAALTAARVASLRDQGATREAQALAEACTVVADDPRGCLRQLEDLSRAAANESNDTFDWHRSRTYGRLADGADAETIRTATHSLFENDFAIDASYVVPSVESTRAQVLEFVARAVELEEAGEYHRLASEAAACSLRHGQFGVICRDFFDRAVRHPGVVASTPATEVARESDTVGHLRRMINATRADRLSEVVGEKCESWSTEVESCQRIRQEAESRLKARALEREEPHGIF